MGSGTIFLCLILEVQVSEFRSLQKFLKMLKDIILYCERKTKNTAHKSSEFKEIINRFNLLNFHSRIMCCVLLEAALQWNISEKYL